MGENKFQYFAIATEFLFAEILNSQFTTCTGANIYIYSIRKHI